MSYIRTYTGKKFYPLDPRPEDVDIRDIAHALSLICRFTGHVKWFYSVAQHSLLVSSKLPKDLKLPGLLHDASEAYIADIARPVKNDPEFGKLYSAIEDKLMRTIFVRYGMVWDYLPEIKKVDGNMGYTESITLINGPVCLVDGCVAYKNLPLGYMDPARVETLFLQAFQKYGGKQ